MTLTWAVRLMYAGAAVTMLNVLPSFIYLDDLRQLMMDPAVSQNDPISPDENAVIMTVVLASMVFLSVITALLWVWMAAMNSCGRSWARVMSTAFFGVGSVLDLVTVVQQPRLFTILGAAILFAIGLAAVICLWQKESSTFYESRHYYR
ncbi:hypothetical protein KEM60_03185 [Austwickia sp. TVS 96-490-7B]|uniref:hypothetical protein n=1 Tax=Austwickia sp. TVS 96-490-7B TaxID=2830843 RepID=UPI001C58B44D|nr:hypothetical protein [Austwickia sp. TVS 96-490-7B]MBW3086956.1 hypothetical protein [Austwickia sp. TVS 96-490-7B]